MGNLKNKTAVIVHAGAGAWNLKPELAVEARKACNSSAEQALALLESGGSALDAAELAVRILEDCPAANAGIGSYLNVNGNIELDAAVMSGIDLSVGAVACVHRIKNPVKLARLVMEKSPHCLLVGAGAETFAKNNNILFCDESELITSEQQAAFDEWASKINLANSKTSDTVGAVALDSNGSLATAISTGGTARKLAGRVGDSPLVGCGFYANNTCAVTATGQGEYLMRLVISKNVSDAISKGKEPQLACDEAIRLLALHFPNAGGGIISLNKDANAGVSFNTFDMPYAIRSSQ